MICFQKECNDLNPLYTYLMAYTLYLTNDLQRQFYIGMYKFNMIYIVFKSPLALKNWLDDIIKQRYVRMWCIIRFSDISCQECVASSLVDSIKNILWLVSYCVSSNIKTNGLKTNSNVNIVKPTKTKLKV